jgi:hypothetical protein
VKLEFFSYRFAEEVLASAEFRNARKEAYDILKRLPAIRVGSPLWHKWRNLNKKKPKATGADPEAMNRWLDVRFKKKGWQYHPSIVAGTKLEGDFRKSRIQMEVQFGNMARWTYDVMKFQICYAQDEVDVGILVVPMRKFALECGSNIAHFERVKRELPYAKLSITLPIMVIGIEP